MVGNADHERAAGINLHQLAIQIAEQVVHVVGGGTAAVFQTFDFFLGIVGGLDKAVLVGGKQADVAGQAEFVVVVKAVDQGRVVQGLVVLAHGHAGTAAGHGAHIINIGVSKGADQGAADGAGKQGFAHDGFLGNAVSILPAWRPCGSRPRL